MEEHSLAEQGLAEEALRRSEMRLRLALQAGQLGEWELDVATDTSIRAPRHDQIFGYDAPIEKWGYDAFMSHVLPEDREHVEVAFKSALAKGVGWHFECRIRRANDGEIRWIAGHGLPQIGTDGRAERFFGLVSDITERRQAQEVLRHSEQRFRTLFNSMGEAFYLTEVLFDGSGRAIDILYLEENLTAVSLVGAEARGRRLTEINPGFDREWLDIMGSVAKTGEPQRLERRSDLTAQWLCFHIFKPESSANQVGVIIQDITARRQAEEALRQSEERYRLIVENARDYAIIITDPEDRIVEWLPGAEAVFGWTAKEAIGQPSAITFTPMDRAQGAPEWEVETAAREGHAPDVRWHQRKDGGHVFIEGMTTPLRNEDGSIRGYLKIGQDVSERRSAQEALEASERRMRMLVTGIPQLVFRSLSSGERIWGSPQWIEYSGLSFEESLGFGWLDALHPDDRQASMDAWDAMGERGEYYVEHRIRKAATGEYRWHQTRAVPSGDEQGQLEWLGTSSDVEELRQLYRHQQTLLAELQHRVRNTLGVVRSITRRTAETSENVEAMAMHLEGRLGAFSRVQTLVTRHPDAGVDLTGLIEDELLAHAAREGEGLRIQGPDISLKPRAAETVSLAIHELATNAVKYGALGAEHGRIQVRWQRSMRDGSEWLQLVWEENGLELPPNMPERQGFGLELLTRTLPYDLRGTTEVEFRREGLRFSMALPLGPDVLSE